MTCKNLLFCFQALYYKKLKGTINTIIKTPQVTGFEFKNALLLIFLIFAQKLAMTLMLTFGRVILDVLFVYLFSIRAVLRKKLIRVASLKR